MKILDLGLANLSQVDGGSTSTGSLDKQVRIWDLGPKTPVEKAKFPMEQWVQSVHFAGSSDYVVAVSSKNQITLYNRATEKVEKEWFFEARRGTKLAEGAMHLLIGTSALAPDGMHLAFSNHTTQMVILRLPIPVKP